MEQRQKSDIEKIAIATPIFYAFIIFCGSLYQYIYYDHFGISIFKYLELSEILVSFFDILILILILFGYFLLLLMAFPLFLKLGQFVEKIVSKIKSILKLKQKEKKTEPSSQKSFNKNNLLLLVFVFSTVYIVSVILFSLSTPEYTDTLNLVYVIYMVLVVLLIGYEIIDNKNKITYEEKRRFLLYIVMAFTVSTVWSSVIDIEIKTQTIKKQVVTIVSNDTIIKTDTNYFYVGRTNNYIFLRNSSENRTDVISEKEIKEISFEYKN